MANTDPFACFGDDDSDSSDGDGGNVQAGRHLAAAFNAKKTTTSSPPPPGARTRDVASLRASRGLRASREDQARRAASLPWPRRPPLYLGPVELRSRLAEGGHRGYVAARDLPPGTCVLVEAPLVPGWSDAQTGRRLGWQSVRHLLERSEARSTVRCLEELHPRREHVGSVFKTERSQIMALDRTQIVDMMNGMADHDQAKALAKYANENEITNSDNTRVDERDIKRLLLALRYNGFESGLYLHFAMFNHSEDPNCIKFRPAEDGGGGTARQYSEARTTRHVRKGDALTISYLENPREVCHATRRKVLWDQHRFDIGHEEGYRRFLDSSVETTGHLFNDNERSHHIFVSELVRGVFPPSLREGPIKERDNDEAPATTNIENSLDDLEDMWVELKSVLSNESANDDKAAHFDRAAELELTVGELITASQSSLQNPHHILLSRCHRLHLDAIELLLTTCSSQLTEKQSADLVLRGLPSIRALLQSQRRRLGGDHPDVARTHQDYSNALQALLSRSPRRLLALRLEGLGTLDECSRTEHDCRREKERIEAQYPRDVDEILASVQSP